MARTLVSALLVVTMLGGTAVADDENPWKPVFYGSLALTIGTTAVWGLSYASMHDQAGQIEASKPGGGTITQDDCNDRSDITGDEGGHLDRACTWRSRSRTASVFALGFGLVTLATAYMAFVDGGEQPPASKLAVSPTFSRDGAGAQLVLRW